jgi:hypothetical protein
MTEEVKGLSYVPLIHKAYDDLVAVQSVPSAEE